MSDYKFDTSKNYLHSEYLINNFKNKNPQNISDILNYTKKFYIDSNFFKKDTITFSKLNEISQKLDLPIENQNKSCFYLLNKLSNQIINLLKNENINLPYKITVGTFPLKDFNAFITEISHEELLIILHESIFSIVYSLSRIITYVIPSTVSEKAISLNFDIQKIKKFINTNKFINTEFSKLLISYFNIDNSNISLFNFLENPQKEISFSLYNTAEFFIVAHEYSHLIIENSINNQSNLIDIDCKETLIALNYLNEFNADDLALQLTLKSLECISSSKFNVAFSYSSIELTFNFLSLIDNIKDTLNIPIDFDTHPPYYERLNRLRDSLKYFAPEHHEYFLGISSVINQILLELWKKNKTLIYKKIKQIYTQ